MSLRTVVVGFGLVCAFAFAQRSDVATRFDAPDEVVAWVRANAIPLETATPGSYNLDLEPFKEMIGDARIVALGEATHGTSEFFRLKHRVIRFLAEEMDFTLFSIEANLPEAYRLNEYVLTGAGDPQELLEGLYFWTWNTEEVLDLILWMRDFNASGRGVMQFTGFDMQYPGVAAQEVRDFVARYEPTYLAVLDQAYTKTSLPLKQLRNMTLDDTEIFHSQARDVLEHLQQSTYDAATPGETAWALQNAQVVVQGAENLLVFQGQRAREKIGTATRDESMAENVRWILEQNPDEKIVLWAHNFHVGKSGRVAGPSMGAVLAEHYGDDYFSVGFVFYEGDYSAVDLEEGLRANTAAPANPSSLGNLFHRVGLPLFALDLRRVTDSGPTAWLAEPQYLRMMGAFAVENAYERLVLPEAFDAVLFVDRMTASKLLVNERAVP